MDKISPKKLKSAIIAEARRINRKKEIWNQVQEIEKELSSLNESGMIGGYGFAVDGDMSQKSKTGFVDDSFFGISNIARLDAEMKDENEDTINEDAIDEMKKLKEEIEALKKENESLKESTKTETEK